MRQSLELIGHPDKASAIMTELHSLAGEAALLGLTEISESARDGELAAKEWMEGELAAKLRCVRAVRAVSRLIEAYAAEEPDATPPPDDSPLLETMPAQTPPEPEPEPAPAPRDERHRVLVIDDSFLSGEQIVDALCDADLLAELAMDRESALAAVERLAPALILSDVNMPGIDLVALCRDLRHASRAPVHLVLLSSMPEDTLARRAQEVQADAYITKQRGTDHVVERMRHILAELRS